MQGLKGILIGNNSLGLSYYIWFDEYSIYHKIVLSYC